MMRRKRKKLLKTIFILLGLSILTIIIFYIIGNKKPEIKKNIFTKHKKVYVQKPLPPIETDKEIFNYLLKGQLVSVKEQPGYKINKLSHSKPVLTKGAYAMLRIIGLAFQKEAGGDNYFVVTSLTRTLSNQKDLTKRNINATKNISAHSYGTSFDISYVRFNGVKEDNYALKMKLGKILATLQKKGKIFVKKERKVACFHITSRI